MRETKQNREIKKEDSFNISSTEDISFENLSKKDFEWTRKSLLSTKDLKKEEVEIILDNLEPSLNLYPNTENPKSNL